MEFTIQDKIDIYHVILGAIEAKIEFLHIWIGPRYPHAVCQHVSAAREWYGAQGYTSLNWYNNETTVNHIYRSTLFAEWYKFEPDTKLNIYISRIGGRTHLLGTVRDVSTSAKY